MVLIPRVNIAPSVSGLSFELVRRQYPIRLAFAMTINKAQDQSLTRAGIYLSNPVFTHVQFYMAISRVGDLIDLKFYVGHAKATEVVTSNVVYTEVLT